MKETTREEELVREYFPEIDDIHQTESIEVLPLTMEDMLQEYKEEVLLEFIRNQLLLDEDECVEWVNNYISGRL